MVTGCASAPIVSEPYIDTSAFEAAPDFVQQALVMAFPPPHTPGLRKPGLLRQRIEAAYRGDWIGLSIPAEAEAENGVLDYVDALRAIGLYASGQTAESLDVARPLFARSGRPAIRTALALLWPGRIASEKEESPYSVTAATSLADKSAWAAADIVLASRWVAERVGTGTADIDRLLRRLRVDYPQYPAVRELETKLPPPRGERYPLSEHALEDRLTRLVDSYQLEAAEKTLRWKYTIDRLGQTKSRLWLGKIRFLQRDYRKALGNFKEVLRAAPESSAVGREASLMLARTYARLEQPAKARAGLRKIVQLNGGDKWACEARYRLYLISGYDKDGTDREQLMNEFFRSCADRETATNMRWERIRLEFIKKDYRQALGYAEAQDKRLSWSDPLEKATAVEWRVQMLQRLGRQAEAADLLAQTARVFPLSAYDYFRPVTALALFTTPNPVEVAIEPDFAQKARLIQQLLEANQYEALEWELDRMRGRPLDAAEMRIVGNIYQLIGAWTKSVELGGDLRANKSAWDDDSLRMSYPQAFAPVVTVASAALTVPTELVYAIMREESRFQKTIRSWVGAQGLMQLMPETARRVQRTLIEEDEASDLDEAAPDLTNPTVNILIGSQYLARLLRHYNGNLVYTIAAYNAGEKAVDQWVQRLSDLPLNLWIDFIPYTQTHKYVKKVLTSFVRYSYLARKSWQPPETIPSTAAVTNNIGSAAGGAVPGIRLQSVDPVGLAVANAGN